MSKYHKRVSLIKSYLRIIGTILSLIFVFNNIRVTIIMLSITIIVSEFLGIVEEDREN